AVWLFYELPHLDRSIGQASFFPCQVNSSCVAPVPGANWEERALTSLFMHGSWLHLLANMLFLWIFGNNVDDAMRRIRFFLFYVRGGLAATALQTWITFRFGSPGDTQVPNLGASGAISAVLAAYMVLLPTARVLTLIVYFFIEIPAYLFIGGWFLFQ